ncbi:MAG: hypothetical protein U5L04_16555 [Trueperaceae bacterium]|nr:hypothetical protein [Trueperaceae bacterium]
MAHTDDDARVCSLCCNLYDIRQQHAPSDTPRTSAAAPERDERRRYRARAHRALDTMADVLPVYHEVCGTVAYHYALNEVRRLRGAVSEQPLSVAELVLLERSVEAQTFGIVRAIRQARGNSAEPDA